MFEWLEREINEIKTPRFHVVEGPANTELEEAVTRSGLPLSRAYMEFVLKFGNAKLYRNSLDGHMIRVFAGPREAILKNGEQVYYLGFNSGASVYVKPSTSMIALPIFEFEDIEEKVADDFAEWLRKSCNLARKNYGKKWEEILRGPKSFTHEEQELVEVRGKIQWKVVGIDEQKNLIFEVTNKGNRSLPFLTIGVRSKDRGLNGAVRLDVHSIGPGQTGLLHRDCYKEFRRPEEIEAFALPEPRPEDRDYYWEFGKR